jgi:four helix bundle suffix protein
MQLKLLNVARASIQELREDYNDFLRSKQMEIWAPANQRYQPMVDFCKQHNKSTDYEPFFEKWSAEEMANIALTLCHMTDTMMNKFLKRLEQDFVTQGGIKERMYAARTGYRKQQDDHMAALEAENRRLKSLLDAHGIKY